MASVIHVTDVPRLPPRRPDAHKGDFGHVLVVGGSDGMAGAPALAGMAALRAGAGLVTIACPDVVADVVAGFEPSVMTLPLSPHHDEVPEGELESVLADWDEDGLNETAAQSILDHRSTVLAIGPGLGRQPRTAMLVQALLKESTKPIILDADGLNAVIDSLDGLKRSAPTVLTPHPGEFASLTGQTTASVQSNRGSLAVAFANAHGVVVVLKGAGTIVTDGERVYVNQTGNPGMATGGTGDVLTGLIAGLVAQKLTPFDAAVLGVHIHGLCGDLAASESAQQSLIASDLVRALPMAWRRFHERG